VTKSDDWDTLRATWQADQAPDEQLTAARSRAERALRSARSLTATAHVVALVCIAGVFLALGHAGNAFERILGASVATAIALAWLTFFVVRRDEHAALEAPTSSYLAEARRLLARQRTLMRLVWFVALLELLFLVPWWIGGVPVHRAQYFSPLAIAAVWLPMIAIVGFAVWSLRVHRRTTIELRALARVEQELGNE
jgi:hypothetical protein